MSLTTYVARFDHRVRSDLATISACGFALRAGATETAEIAAELEEVVQRVVVSLVELRQIIDVEEGASS